MEHNNQFLATERIGALTAVYLLFPRQIVALFGGTVNEETFRYSREYFFYISLGIPFYMFGQAMNPIIRADGSLKFAKELNKRCIDRGNAMPEHIRRFAPAPLEKGNL